MLIRDLLCYNIKCPSLLALIPIYVPARTLRARFFIFQRAHNTRYGCNEPLSRSIVYFNEVSLSIDFLCLTREKFKSEILYLFKF